MGRGPMSVAGLGTPVIKVQEAFCVLLSGAKNPGTPGHWGRLVIPGGRVPELPTWSHLGPVN